MKRRELIKGAAALAAVGLAPRAAFSKTPCPPQLSGAPPNPCPSPGAPAWYSSLATNEAHVFSGSAWSSALGPAPGTGGIEVGDVAIFSYSGGVLNTTGVYEGTTFRPGPWLCLHGGGHGAYNGNEVAAYGPLTSETPDWIWTAPAAPAATDTHTNGQMPASQHTYGHLEYLSSVNKLLVPVISSRYLDSASTNRSFTFDFSLSDPANNLQTAWEDSAVADNPGGSNGAYYGACGGYDASKDAYWYVDGFGQTYLAKYDVQANRWTRYPSSGFKSTVISYSDRKTCAIDPVSQVMLIASSDSPPIAFDLRNPNGEFYTPAGNNRPQGQGGVLFDPANRRWVYYEGGNTMWFCRVPANPYAGGDDFNWTPVTMSGPAAPTLPSHPGSGVYNRWRYCPDPRGYVAIVGWDRNVVFVRA